MNKVMALWKKCFGLRKDSWPHQRKSGVFFEVKDPNYSYFTLFIQSLLSFFQKLDIENNNIKLSKNALWLKPENFHKIGQILRKLVNST